MSKRIITIMALAALTTVAGTALAGNCGSKSSTKHASYSKHEDGEAIFPLAREAGFTTLTAAIEAAGLDEVLTQDGPFTVFAPTDEAFAKLPDGTVEALLEDKEALTKVLLYHVTNGTVTASDVVDLRAARTLNGEKIQIDLDDGVMINDANVVKTDVMASNGVIHVIDTVLIPDNL